MIQLRDISLNQSYEPVIGTNGDFQLTDSTVLALNNKQLVFVPNCDRVAIQILLIASIGEIKHAPQVGAAINAEIEGDGDIVQRTRIKNKAIFSLQNSGHFKVDSFVYSAKDIYNIDFRRIKWLQ